MTHPQYHPVHIEKLSPAVIAKMLNGHRVRIKHGNHHVIHLSHEQHKKHVSAHKKGAGHIIQFDPFQQQMEVHQKLRHGHSHPHTHGYGRQLTESSSFHAHHGWGEGVCGEGGRGKKGARRGRGPFDIFKSVVKAVAPIAINEGSKFLSNKIEGWGEGMKKRGRPRKTGIGARGRKHKRGGDINDDLRKAFHTVEDVAPIALPLLMGLGEGGHTHPRHLGHHRRSHGEALFPAGYGE